jgi:ubiquinone/menaquinone biosynthesis C-methylase UbiE
MNKINEEVQDYYGKELKSTEDLQTNACCTLEAPPTHIMKALSNVHDDVQAKYYGCGLTIPDKLQGLRILDLGSGSGRDCYIAAQLVGENGSVVGVDMTDEQLAVAREYEGYHQEKFGYKNKNTEFLKGNIEKLDELNLEPGSFDLIISNCVINLASDKDKVLRDAFNLLKPGGEMYFSDVYSDRRISKELQNDKVLWGECLSGALYWNDFEQISKSVGFKSPRSVESKIITVNNDELQKKLGDIKFFSITYRLFKNEDLELGEENFNLSVKYLGDIDETGDEFLFDDKTTFKKGENYLVSGNTFNILKGSRYKGNFEFIGNQNTHYGIFNEKAVAIPFTKPKAKSSCC